MNDNTFVKLENIVRKNLGKRGLGHIKLVGELEKGAKNLLTSSTVFIVTGFVIRDTLTGETDGPIGSISLAGALEQLGKDVVLVTDKYSKEILYNCSIIKNIKATLVIVPHMGAEEFCVNLLHKYKPSHVVGIERPGRTKEGFCYSMRGEDLSDIVPNTDILFEKSKELGITTLAVGDGGNEVGMGKVESLIVNYVDKGNQICASVSTDYLIVAGVSNWGGHAITGALSLLTDTMLLHDNDTEIRILESMILAGAVDGCTKEKTLSVDGLSLDINLQVLQNIRNLVEIDLKNSVWDNSNNM